MMASTHIQHSNNSVKACVIIPVYKSELNTSEIISIKQTTSILSKYDIYIVTYQGLNLNKYLNINSSLKIQYFDAKYFANIKGYNKLCMSNQFYGKFKIYDFMLIAQLDSYIFKDELLYWCNKNYDYIGAPWLEIEKIKSVFDLSPLLLNKVGNGGFSLRKIKTFERLSYKYRFFSKFFPKNEDFFWCIIVPRLNKNFFIPTVNTSLKFAIETKPSLAFKINHHTLPFGCHAFDRYEPEFWKTFIPS